MRVSYIIISTIVLLSSFAFGQNELTILLLDGSTYKPVHRAHVVISELNINQKTKANGMIYLNNIPDGPQVLKLTHEDYETKEISVEFPIDVEIYTARLKPIATEYQEVVIEATRADRTVRNLPTRTEVLTERIESTASMDPSTIAHLIGHSTGIRIQGTTVASGGKTARIQGLKGRYTQLLRDGFPLYGGLSSSMDLLEIPPLDLRQVEYIKGPASTLYGSGAIGGVINMVSKRPEQNETMLHENLSTIGARDFNAIISKDFGKIGFTSLASLYMHNPYDADNDGYSDMPDVLKIHFSPKFYYYPSNKTEVYLGGFITTDRRMGGDMNLINNFNADSSHFFFDAQISKRLSSQLLARHTFKDYHSIKLRNSVSFYNRSIQIRENAVGAIITFEGKELGTFTELNYNFKKPSHDLNAGLNFYSNSFQEEEVDSSALRDQQTLTYAAYLNYLWFIHKSFAIEAGLRGDYVQAESRISKSDRDLFVLPRLSMLFKLGKEVSLRLGGGMGYRMPTIFNVESEQFAYKNINAIDYGNVKAEESYGANFDIKYETDFGTKNFKLFFNNSFFYNLIDNPIQLIVDSSGMSYGNYGDQLTSAGFETQLKLNIWKFELYAGYTYTDVFTADSNGLHTQTLTPRHNLKGDLSFVVKDKWRIGWDFEYNSEQILSTGLKSPSYFMTGIMAERRLGNFAIFANFENITDVRQTRYESLLGGMNNTTQYTEIWAPLDGFFFNWGVKVRF